MGLVNAGSFAARLLPGSWLPGCQIERRLKPSHECGEQTNGMRHVGEADQFVRRMHVAVGNGDQARRHGSGRSRRRRCAWL